MPDDIAPSLFRSDGFAPYKLVRAVVRAPMRPALDDAPPFKGKLSAARAEPVWNFHAECSVNMTEETTGLFMQHQIRRLCSHGR